MPTSPGRQTDPRSLWNRLHGKLLSLWAARREFLIDLRQCPAEVIHARRTGRTPYVLPAVDYSTTSAGRVACHRLIHELNTAGYHAFSVGLPNPDWNERRLTRAGLRFMNIFAKPIIIYPEVIVGNPFKAKRVVRWTLNSPGRIGGDIEFDKNELVYTWSQKFFNTHRVLSWDLVDRKLFNTDDLPIKSGSCFFIGKGRLRGAVPIELTDGLTEITGEWPPTRGDLARLLRQSEVLYTYDDMTMLSVEALLCGCRVILLPEHREIHLHDDEWQFLREDHDALLARFIKETQSYWKAPQ